MSRRAGRTKADLLSLERSSEGKNSRMRRTPITPRSCKNSGGEFLEKHRSQTIDP